MFIVLFFLFGCMSEQMLTNKIVEERIIYDTAYVEVIVEVEKEVEVEVIVEEEYPVWGQTYNQHLETALIYFGLWTHQAP